VESQPALEREDCRMQRVALRKRRAGRTPRMPSLVAYLASWRQADSRVFWGR
jgi:hypothetical protein